MKPDYDPSFDSEPYEASAEEDNWLVSYADLLTNLLAFFVLLFAISHIQNVRFEQLTRTLTSQPAKVGMTELKQSIDRFISKNQLSSTLDTSWDEHGLEIRFKTVVLFEQGSALLSRSGCDLLQSIGEMVQQLGAQYSIVVEGHTDDVPIHNTAYESNWELSAQRGVNVVKRLIELGVKPTQLSAQAYADTRPTQIPGSADIEEQRASNRRVVVRVY